MQTPKASRKSFSEASQGSSPSTQTPQKSSTPTNRAVRQLKVGRSDSGSVASSSPSSNTPKKSLKVLERGSPRTPPTEKKRPAKLSELESQVAQLQDELKTAMEQLISSESSKRQAEQEAEETKKHLAKVTARFEDSQQQLMELSSSEDARVLELRKLSHDRDRAWQSELEAMQNQYSMDSAALSNARNEIQKLKRQLEMVSQSEAEHSMHAEAAYEEFQSLKTELSDALLLVERMKEEIGDCKESEARALKMAREAQVQLEAAMAEAECLRSEGVKGIEEYRNIDSELQQSKERVCLLEDLVSKLQGDLESKNSMSVVSEEMNGIRDDNVKNEEAEMRKGEIESLKVEIGQLKSALEASELRYQEEYIQSTLQIRNAYDQVELARTVASTKEAELNAELKKARATIEELQSELKSKEGKLENFEENNKELNIKVEENENSAKTSELEVELKKLKEDLEDLKAVLLDKETRYQNTTQENEMLKAEIQKREGEKSKANEEANALALAAKSAEREALMKLGYVTEEADKSSRKVTRVEEQLNAAQKTNTELEGELRRLKVQADQWRKAAEAAAAMLSSGKDGKFVERTVSFDTTNYNTVPTKMDSLSDDMDDESLKKKNGNMLKKIGVLWKKGQK